MYANSLKWLLLPLLLLAAASLRAESHDGPLYDRISLSASAAAEVDEDRMVAVLFALEEGRDAERLAALVNEAVQWGVATSRGREGITVTTQGYRSSPVYRDNRISGWRVRQSIRVVGSDAARFGTLLGELQQRLNIESLGNEVTDARLDAVRDRLTRDALQAFRGRAALIAEELGGSGYRIVQLHVGDVGAQPVRPVMMEMRVAAAAPAVEPGTQTVRIEVNGVVELQRP